MLFRSLLLFIITLTAFAKMTNRERAIYKLILDEEKSIFAVRNQNSSLRYRFFELQNEKLKHFAREENERFIKKPGAKREKYFKQTKKQHFYLKKLAYELKKAKGSKKFIAQTFLALSLSARDYKFDDQELKYLKIADRYVKKPSNTSYLINISLAEYYYNVKEYKKSNRLYKYIVKNKKDQWHTKHMYNYAWTQFKIHLFDRAIVNLEKAYRLSKGKKFVDLNEQIMNSLIIFYITHKQVDRAIAFIQQHEKISYDPLFKLARKASSKGFFQDANKIVSLLYKRKLTKEETVDVKVFELGHYRLFNKRNSFNKIVKDLAPLKVPKDLKEEVTILITEEVRDLQQILKKAFDIKNGSYSTAALSYALFYFNQLKIKYDKKNALQYNFFSAETLYSVNEHRRSIPFYKSALNKKDPFGHNRQSIEALYVAIEAAKLAKPSYERNLEFIYKKVVKFWPKEKKTLEVYKKLFYLYLSQKNHKKMDYALTQFRKFFPKSIDEQKKLFKMRVDLYIKQKDSKALAAIVKKLKRKYLSFSTTEVVAVEDILANMLFNNFKALRVEGSDELALKGYLSIYVDASYTRKIRAQAAFNSAIIHVDLGDSNSTIKWMRKTKRMDKNIYAKHKNDFVKLADRTLLKQDFAGAENLYKLHLTLNCSEKKQNIPIFRNILNTAVARAYTRKAVYYYNKYTKCIEPKEKEAIALELTEYFANQNEYKWLYSFAKKNRVDRKKTFAYLEELFWTNKQDSSILGYIRKLNVEPSATFLAIRKSYNDLVKMSDNAKEKEILFTKEMKPEAFNIELTKYFELVSGIIAQSDKILSYKNSHYSLFTINETKGFLANVSKKIEAIKSPILDKNFLTQFNGQMKALAKNFKDQSENYNKTLEKFKHDYKITFQLDPKKVNNRLPASVRTIDLEVR